MSVYFFSLHQNKNDLNKFFMNAQPGKVHPSVHLLMKNAALLILFFEENVVNTSNNKMCDYDLPCKQLET